MTTHYRAELFLESRLRETERKRLEVVEGRLKGIVDPEIQDRVLESYQEEIKMYKYLLDLLVFFLHIRVFKIKISRIIFLSNCIDSSN